MHFTQKFILHYQSQPENIKVTKIIMYLNHTDISTLVHNTAYARHPNSPRRTPSTLKTLHALMEEKYSHCLRALSDIARARGSEKSISDREGALALVQPRDRHGRARASEAVYLSCKRGNLEAIIFHARGRGFSSAKVTFRGRAGGYWPAAAAAHSLRMPNGHRPSRAGWLMISLARGRACVRGPRTWRKVWTEVCFVFADARAGICTLYADERRHAGDGGIYLLMDSRKRQLCHLTWAPRGGQCVEK